MLSITVGVTVAATLVVAGATFFIVPRVSHADTNGCPSGGIGNPQTDNLVGAGFTVAGTTASYTFSSFANESSSGGVPGLIEYCIYSTDGSGNPLAPDSSTVLAHGADGSAWVDPPAFDNFSFKRGDGNPSNIALDGTTGIAMGTATWNGGVPDAAHQVILLHVNDPAVCDALYSGNPGTCFVLPGTPPQRAQDLSVTKDASPSFTRTYTWGIAKSVDQTKVISGAGSALFTYTVNVTHDTGTDSAWQVTGTITVHNPNSSLTFLGVNIADAVDDGGSCTVAGGTGAAVAPGDNPYTYTCTYASQPDYGVSATNTATASWDGLLYDTPDSSASGSAHFIFDSGTAPNPTLIDTSVSVTDTLGGTLGTVAYTDPIPTTFTYQHTVTGTLGTCVTQDNTAMFTTNTTGSTGSSSQSVQLCTPEDLQVTKNATPGFTRTDTWAIAKNADKTHIEQIGGTATVTYTVTVTQTGFTDSGWHAQGQIALTNPNDFFDFTGVNVSDAVDDGGSCTVSGGSGVTVPAGKSVSLSYTCTYASQPPYNTTATNTATATWDGTSFNTPDSTASGAANFTFDDGSASNPQVINQCVTITDSFAGTLGTDCVGTDPATKTFTYQRTFTVPTFNCSVYPNTATITETGQTANASVEVCGPAKTGALTMGFWQNKNGQGIITSGASTGNKCNLGTYLGSYAPFQDLKPGISGLSCAQVATYVYNVIKAANAGGSTMNAMLKAQMLATALDVYFSDPALGGNKIGAPAPIGGVAIDLTKICAMSDGSGGGTCSGSYENVSSAFGGASSLTVAQMLAYAASQSNVGGSIWYGNVKATQGLAKDAFDAINNQKVFSA